MPTVSAGARLHVGFCNLSLAHERLYGGIGVALDEPRVSVTAEPADAINAESADTGDPDDLAAEYAALATELLDVPGAHVTVEDRLPRHVGLGSGTQLALTIYAAIARAYDEPVDVREAAPDLGRGGRSGVGVAAFQRGGFVVDGGHPTARFTTERPPRGEWTVPPIVARHELPEDWRFVLAMPAVAGEDGQTAECQGTEPNRGRHGEDEDAAMRTVVEQATPAVADQVSAVLTRKLLPAAAQGDRAAFGDAVAEIERLNGSWYADAQGGVFRPPAGAIVESMQASDAIDAAGQSSWGPTVYGLSSAEHAAAARDAAAAALDAAGCDGTVRVVSPTNEGATVGGA
ncbi:GHMP kinase putative ATP-binding protein [Salinarchaeum sp. Harcht-Bsk1]|uniref:beta-ribofuranosylaminobenzene 5'-phosphate synthase family protein n=1 Tax=Salinarchaeum sp. Harcht-Bsk1 TaxID=1333523 RepID=UPI0003422C24|nr:beta-ribofuranosylaminobenzene 5'-phosphate synthase family protein [Salinarchaeum sp. Harcht-Bsk1]AGN00957.1 GHMP kinase putative ATP-binding protein [Salinarchaeum sp. Harcht-Bsk1]